MRLRIRGPENRQIDLDNAEATWTVKTLRETIAGMLTPPVPPERLKLILMGRVINDEQTLAELHVEDDHVVHMVVRPDGVPPSPAPQAETAPPPQPRMGTFNVFTLDGNTGATTHTAGGPGGVDGLGGLLAGLFSNVVPQATAAFTTIHQRNAQQQPAAASSGIFAAPTGVTSAPPTPGQDARSPTDPVNPPASTTPAVPQQNFANPADAFAALAQQQQNAARTEEQRQEAILTQNFTSPQAALAALTAGRPPQVGGLGGMHHHHLHMQHHGHHVPHHHPFLRQQHHLQQQQQQLLQRQQEQLLQQQNNSATQAAETTTAAVAPATNNTNISGVQLHLHVSLADLDQVPAALHRLNQNLASPVELRVANSAGEASAAAANSAANAATAAASASANGVNNRSAAANSSPPSSTTTAAAVAPITLSTTKKSIPPVNPQALSRPPPTPAARPSSSTASRSSSTPQRQLPPGRSLAKALAATINSNMRVPHELLELQTGQYGGLVRIHSDIQTTLNKELKRFAESSAGIAAAGGPGGNPMSPSVRHAWMKAVAHDVVEASFLETRMLLPQGEVPLAALFHNTAVKSSWSTDLHVLVCIQRAVFNFLDNVLMGKFLDVRLPTATNEESLARVQAWAKSLHEACIKSIGGLVSFLGDEYFQGGIEQSIQVFQTFVQGIMQASLGGFFPTAVPFQDVLTRFVAGNVHFWATAYKSDRHRSHAEDIKSLKTDRPAPVTPTSNSAAAAASSSSSGGGAAARVASPSAEQILDEALEGGSDGNARSEGERATTPPGEKRQREA